MNYMKSGLINQNASSCGIYRAILDWDGTNAKIYIPGLFSNAIEKKELWYDALFSSYEMRNTAVIGESPCWVTFENGDMINPIIMGYFGKGIRSIGGSVSISSNTNSGGGGDKNQGGGDGNSDTDDNGDWASKVGKRITDTSTYNNGAAIGQCVWYVLGRASERNGKTITIGGNGNSMYQYAKPEAVLSATADNLKGNMILCYSKGTSTAGQKYGHCIFIEAVVGNDVYYTEGGSGYYKNKTDGVVKTGTKEQILNGVNASGARIGTGAAGLIDLSKY